jgi:putative Holliday junction resolvase
MILPMAELRAALAPGQRLLGLDPGARTIGIALSDVRLMLSTPYAQMKRGKLTANAAEIASIAARQGAGGGGGWGAPPPPCLS